jgi:hypothetical protein
VTCRCGQGSSDHRSGSPVNWIPSKLDGWLTRLLAVPPARNPLANGIAIGMRIALFILVPLGIIAAIANSFPSPIGVCQCQL